MPFTGIHGVEEVVKAVKFGVGQGLGKDWHLEILLEVGVNKPVPVDDLSSLDIDRIRERRPVIDTGMEFFPLSTRGDFWRQITEKNGIELAASK